MVIKHPPTNQPADLHIHTNTPVTLRCDCVRMYIYSAATISTTRAPLSSHRSVAEQKFDLYLFNMFTRNVLAKQRNLPSKGGGDKLGDM